MTGAAGDPCGRARRLASEALDGVVADELERRAGLRHLARCRACAELVEEMRTATHALRRAPLAAPRRTVALPARRGPGRSWARAAVLAAALVLPVGTLAAVDGPADASRPDDHVVVELPRGQRSALADFVAEGAERQRRQRYTN